jgi:3-phosphoshikimate 1-carboxyvinyltransferase
MISKDNIKIHNTTECIGEIVVSADKSISHRAVILSSLAAGSSKIDNLLYSKDVIRTLNMFKKLGVVLKKKKNILHIYSLGFKNLKPNKDKIVLNAGNSGTTARLMMGVLSGLNFNTKITLTGDSSLKKRPMSRVIEPLKLMGADIVSKNGFLPVIITPQKLNSINYQLNIASAQVKSAILLASLFTKNANTTLIEKHQSRNHSELMLKNLGINISTTASDIYDNNVITVNNNSKNLIPYDYNIPNDFSSASFFIILALITPNSNLTIKSVNLNTYRTGLLVVLKQMGAKINILNTTKINGEDVGDINIKSEENNILQGVNVDEKLNAFMIDEFPILAVLSLFAKGETIFNNVEELKYKESNRLKSIIDNLKALGFNVVEYENGLKIKGCLDRSIPYDNKILYLDSFKDHRIAMSFLILGSTFKNTLTVANCKNIDTSFPTFFEIANKIGLNLKYV